MKNRGGMYNSDSSSDDSLTNKIIDVNENKNMSEFD